MDPFEIFSGEQCRLRSIGFVDFNFLKFDKYDSQKCRISNIEEDMAIYILKMEIDLST